MKNTEFSEQYPRGHDVSQELTEVRTVLSRAESALERIKNCRANPTVLDARYGGNSGYDPDGQEMMDDLERVIYFLDRWRKTGKTKRRV
jgi:hypothetical protein